jgi:hypothetical protein
MLQAKYMILAAKTPGVSLATTGGPVVMCAATARLCSGGDKRSGPSAGQRMGRLVSCSGLYHPTATLLGSSEHRTGEAMDEPGACMGL